MNGSPFHLPRPCGPNHNYFIDLLSWLTSLATLTCSKPSPTYSFCPTPCAWEPQKLPLTEASLRKADSPTLRIHKFPAHKSRYAQSRKIATPCSVNHDNVDDNHRQKSATCYPSSSSSSSQQHIAVLKQIRFNKVAAHRSFKPPKHDLGRVQSIQNWRRCAICAIQCQKKHENVSRSSNAVRLILHMGSFL